MYLPFGTPVDSFSWTRQIVFCEKYCSLNKFFHVAGLRFRCFYRSDSRPRFRQLLFLPCSLCPSMLPPTARFRSSPRRPFLSLGHRASRKTFRSSCLLRPKSSCFTNHEHVEMLHATFRCCSPCLTLSLKEGVRHTNLPLTPLHAIFSCSWSA